jgi:hypothetical protein
VRFAVLLVGTPLAVRVGGGDEGGGLGPERLEDGV